MSVLDDLIHDRARQLRGDREADPLVASRAASEDGGVDTDQLAGRVDERTPELPGLMAVSVWRKSS